MPKVPKNFLDKMEKVIRRYHATTDDPLRGILGDGYIKTSIGKHDVYEADGPASRP